MAQPTLQRVQRLVARQFPQWASEELRPVPNQGWDNRSYRLGCDKVLRLPSAERYAPQVLKEQTWLPRLAPHLPVAIPEPLALGLPDGDYPWHWSVMRWIDGETAQTAPCDPVRLAHDLATFLGALHRIDAGAGPAAGRDNFHRGGDLSVYDAETRAVLDQHPAIHLPKARAIWDRALSSHWSGAPVWVHGDLAPGNLLLRQGRLVAVIDWGSSAVGDPACDLAPAFADLSTRARTALRQSLPLDDATWDRAKGWALWKALITRTDPTQADRAARTLRALRL